MSENTKIWHPFPAEKPPKSGRYIVTTSFVLLGCDYRYVYHRIDWSQKHNLWNVEDNGSTEHAMQDVVAWAELGAFPPYMEEINGLPVERGGK